MWPTLTKGILASMLWLVLVLPGVSLGWANQPSVTALGFFIPHVNEQ